MLILSRQLNQKIIINNNICIKVIAIDRKNVKIGIEAPHDVEILREEVLLRLQRHAEEA